MLIALVILWGARHGGRVIEEWIEAARNARTNAYATYSGFAVGAALVDASGRIFPGCNVENISFSVTMCAERVALGSAIVAGVRSFQAIAVVADTVEPISPCGACRQALAEFNPGLELILATCKGKILRCSLADMLPRPSTGILDHA